jgi:signal transduction histidine kinase
MSTKPILIVDDDPTLRKTLTNILTVKGYTCVAADTGETALDKVEEKTPVVALIDLRLGDMSGLEVMREIKERSPDTECILLTGYATQSSAIEAINLGAYSYLLKPYDMEQLLVTIRRAVEKWEAERALRRRNRELAWLNYLSRELTTTLDSQEIADQLLQGVAEILGAEGVSVWLWDEEQEDNLVCWAATRHDGRRSPVNLRLRPQQGVVGWVVQYGESAIVPYVPDDARFFSGIDEQIGFHTTSLLAVPLWVRGKVIGALEVVNKLGGEFDEDDSVLIGTLAASAAIAIDNARLVETLHQYAAKVEARNEELDAFAHTVAHDLKHQVSLVIGYSEVLREDYDTMSDEELYRCLSAVSHNGHKLNDTIEALLLLATVSKMGAEKTPLDMAGIVANTQQRLANIIEAYRAEVTVPQSWPQALGYAPWVEEVWVNYLSNALKYGGRPPRVELGFDVGAPRPETLSSPESSSANELEKKAQLNGGTAGEGTSRMVCFWVRDNGPGITAENQARLFTPFTRLDQVRAEGHGLGLSIVRRIIEKLGGEVGVKSNGVPGHGSVFTFTLPGVAGQNNP